MQHSQEAVTYWSLICGGICFALYVLASITALLARPAKEAATLSNQAKSLAAAPGVSVDELTKLIEAVAKLTDSLSKAGPTLTSLIGALVFFAIASISSGALHSPPPAPAKQASVPAPPAPASAPVAK